MGIFGKALRRRRHRASQDVDLLSVAFGLPFRRGVLRGNGRSPRRMFIAEDYDDGDEADSENGYSSSCESEYALERGRRVSERPSTPHPPITASPIKRSSPKKRHDRRHHQRSPSIASSRKSSRYHVPRSASRRPNVESLLSQQFVSNVRPSATFPPQVPVHLSKPPCNIVQSSTFPAPSLNQSFGGSVNAPQQPVYYQNLAYVPPQPPNLVRVQPPHYLPLPFNQHDAARAPAPVPAPVPVPSACPVLSKASDNVRKPPAEKNTHQLISGSPEGPGPSGSFNKEVQRIQKHIDAKMADLAQEPSSKVLRRDLRRLQDRLNSTLNKAIAVDEKSHREHHQRRPSLSTFSNFSQSVCDQDAANSGQIIPAGGAKRCVQRDESPMRVPRHHFCTECGNIRSMQFHKRHPLSLRKKAKLNLCESCREERFKRGVVQKYHFCFHCGGARSRAFHKKHPILPGDPILANYCESCTLDLQAGGCLPEASVVGSKCHGHEAYQIILHLSDSEEDLDSLTVNRHRNPKSGQTKSIYAQHRAAPSQSQVPEVEKARGRRPEPRDRVASRETDVISPYCPERTTGSSGRRAERQSSGHLGDEPSPHKEKAKIVKNYKAPYIEESFSAPHSRRATPSPTFDYKNSDLQGKQKASQSVQTSAPNLGLKSALAGERSLSDGSQRPQNHAPKESSRPREKSLESDRSDPSSSSRSSGSKTVRFKQSVDIRTALAPDGDTDLSEAETHIPCIRSPGSPLLPRKKPTLYDGSENEWKQNTEYFPHYGQPRMNSPGSCGEQLRTPDSFNPGTPSKSFPQGAFGQEFDYNDTWSSFPTPGYPYEAQYANANTFHGYYEAEKGFQDFTPVAHDFNQYEKCKESTTSLPSYLSSGGTFSSFFKNKKNKASSAPPDPDTCSFADEGTSFGKRSGQTGKNPYYTPRKRPFPDISFCGSPARSDKSAKRGHEQSSPLQSDSFFWNNAFDPFPTVEEASSIDELSPEGSADLLEYDIVADTSSVEPEDSEEHSDRDFSGSDEDVEKTVVPIQPTSNDNHV
ncbi:hypothetical protein F66182_4601 [Fusarium sp. NRRL 66182]|nr:hypothetical protein F66182_4601 [Fusarium sp. NRRL 66182]